MKRICDRCGKQEAIDIFPTGYDGEGNPIDEEALCQDCIYWEEAEKMLEEHLTEECLQQC